MVVSVATFCTSAVIVSALPILEICFSPAGEGRGVVTLADVTVNDG